MADSMNKPCNQCPWRRDSAAGWLGDSTPLEFLQQERSNVHMPCHCTVDYESEDWEALSDAAPACAGRRIFMGNQCRIPRDGSIEPLPADRALVFSNAQEFADHHSRGALRIVVIGDAVMEEQQ